MAATSTTVVAVLFVIAACSTPARSQLRAPLEDCEMPIFIDGDGGTSMLTADGRVPCREVALPPTTDERDAIEGR